jgi:surfeit locus 1 family protein
MPSSAGRPGYRVLTPFELASGGWLLVDRGWVALGATREQLPSVAVEEQQRRVRGRIAPLPSPGLRLESAGGPTDVSWPRVLTYPTRADLQAALQRELPENIVLLDADQPDGFEREWTARLPVGPERHIAYAVQWFAMGTAMLVIFLVMSLKRTSDR